MIDGPGWNDRVSAGSVVERRMETLRIYDLDHQVLACDLHGLLTLFAPRSLEATWTVSTVKSSEPGLEWFEATGSSGQKLEVMAQQGAQLSGPEFAMLAADAGQVIWGQFDGRLTGPAEVPWLTICAIDSTFYEVTISDDNVLLKINSTFNDVRRAEKPYSQTLWPER